MEFNVYVSDAACVNTQWKQFRFPKSKKSRIRKKWRKKNSNFKMVEVHRVIRIFDRMIVSSKIYEKLKTKTNATRI